MTLEYWWAKRNNRRAAVLPDLSRTESPELPGTPETRLAACLAHAHRQLTIAAVRHAQKQAWLAAQGKE